MTYEPKNSIISAIYALICSSVFSGAALAQDADIVLSGGKILTIDDNFSIAESLAIVDGRILAVGDDDDISQHIGTGTKQIALDGKTVIPGLIDNHLHFIRGVWNNQTEVRFGGIKSRKEALQLLAEKAETTENGQWITVMGGWIPDQFLDDNSGFTLKELDEIAPNNPIYLLRNYSNGFANSAAFDAVGISSGGTSVLSGRENLSPFTNAVSWRNKSSSPQAILDYMGELNALGLTMVYDVGRPSEGQLEPLEKLSQEQPLPLRVYHTLRYSARDAESTDAALKLIEGDAKPFSNDLQFGLLGLGEHIYVPVSDNPRFSGVWDEDAWGPFSEISFAAARNGWTVHEHVMSKATALQYIDLIEDIAEEIPSVKDLRWTFAHVNGMADEDISRAAEFGIAFAVHSQASMTSSIGIDSPRIGSIARSGAMWGLGSDAGIVAPANPFWTLEWAVTGANIAGKTAWSEDQQISREAALRAHTLQNAELMFAEKDLGSLEIGKVADLVVLDKDYLSVPESEISTISPVITMVSGNIVHQADE